MHIDMNNTKKSEIRKKQRNIRTENVEILTMYQENIICEEVFVVKNQKLKNAINK